MKKRVAVILLFIWCFGVLFGCTAEDYERDEDELDSVRQEEEDSNWNSGGIFGEDQEEQREKLNEEISFGSPFSDGMAAVVVGGQSGQAYAINKKGEIVFQFDTEVDFDFFDAVFRSQFWNGYIYINGNIWDSEGHVTRPEDVGVSKFYSIALEGGYIIAEVVEADFESTKKSLGIMNSDFEWIVQPTTELYDQLVCNWGMVLNSIDDFYDSNGYVYVSSVDRYLNLKTGEVVSSTDMTGHNVSRTWKVWSDGTYRDAAESVCLDLSMYENIVPGLCTRFKNNKALIVFNNREANSIFFTAVNEMGEFLFEPVDLKMSGLGTIETDGNTILVTDQASGSRLKIRTYDMEGNLLTEFDTDTIKSSIGMTLGYSATINDGVVRIRGGYNHTTYIWYYSAELEPLF